MESAKYSDIETGLKEYTYWGGSNPPTDNLLTTGQCREKYLKPISPAGYIYVENRKSRKGAYKILLYDISDPTSVKPKPEKSQEQIESIKKGRITKAVNLILKKIEESWSSRANVVMSAREIIRNQDKYLVLDTETTSLDNPHIVEIAITDLQGNILLNKRVKPDRDIEEDAFHVHGISIDDLQESPKISDLQVEKIWRDKTVIIYNEDFDLSALKNSSVGTPDKVLCAMRLYSTFVRQKYKNGGWKWQPLPGGDHTALGDCLATAKVLEEIAGHTKEKELEKLADFMLWDNRDILDEVREKVMERMML